MYQLWYAIGLIFVGLATIASIVVTIIEIPQTTSMSDTILFLLCYVVLLSFVVFQIYSCFRAFKKEGVFFKNFLYGPENILSKPTLVIINLFLLLGIAMVIYSGILLSGAQILFSGFPPSLNYLIISVGLLLIVNSIFADFYPLIKDEDKDR